jgi:pimeloyl-ACP methyl ester carboxylesterase
VVASERAVSEPQPSEKQFGITPTEAGRLVVDGCEIAYAVWGGGESRPVVLIHGAGAHMGWWDAVIQELVPHHRVIGLDLSGNGDSGWRDDYSGQQWASEVLAAAQQIGGGAALLVGHSLGGRVAIIAGGLRPDMALGLVLVDAPIRRPHPKARRRFQPSATDRRYESLELAVESFHLRPPEPVLNRDLLQRVAIHSFRQLDGGWGLKADRDVYGRIDDADLAACLAQITSPVTLAYGGRSTSVDEDGRSFLAESHPGTTEFRRIDEGFHHLTFDHAVEVADTIVSLSAHVMPGGLRVRHAD